MKSKKVLLISSIVCAAVLGSCGKTPAMESESKGKTDKEVVQEVVQAESGAENPNGKLQESALSAYREILRAAPTLQGEHEELGDASFDYDRNLALFGQHYDLFAFYDIDQNEVPELIVLSTVNFRWTPVSVYTYADGAAVLLKDPLNPEAHGTFEQCSTADGAYTTYICKDHHIHSVWRGMTPVGEEEENYAYALQGTTLVLTDCSIEEGQDTINFYDIALENTGD